MNRLQAGHKVASLSIGCEVIVIHEGDLCDGNAYVDHLCAYTHTNQVRVATKNLQRWFRPDINLTRMRIVIGTEVHTFKAGSSAVAVHDRLSLLYPDLDIGVLYHLYARLQGQVIDSAHKGPFPGSRKWLKGNSVGWYLKSAMLEELVDGEIPPIVYARAHFHEFVHKTERVRQKGVDVESHLVVSPSYCGLDDWSRGSTRAKRKIDLGLVALEFDEGLKKVHPFYEELDVRTKETW